MGPAGSVSARSTVSPFVIGSGPLFFSVIVQVAVLPAYTGDGLTVFVSARSYRHGRKSIVALPAAPTIPEPLAVGGPATPEIAVGALPLGVGDAATTKLEPPPPPARSPPS